MRRYRWVQVLLERRLTWSSFVFQTLRGWTVFDALGLNLKVCNSLDHWVEGPSRQPKVRKNMSNHILPFSAETLGKWVYQHENGPINRSAYIKYWIEDKNITVLDWIAKRPELNIIKNVSGLMARKVYWNGRHFHGMEELRAEFWAFWQSISTTYIEKL